MNTKKLLVAFIASTILLVGGIAIGGDDKNGPETSSIDLIKGKQKPVEFPHRKHQTEFKGADGKEIKCVSCHHTAKEGTKPKKCSACHVVEGEAQKEHDGKKAPFFAKMKAPGKADVKTVIFHNRCLDGCHKKVAKANPEKKEIAKCKNCHKK